MPGLERASRLAITAAALVGWLMPAERGQASLKEFVAHPDPAFAFRVEQSWQEGDAQITELRLTSQVFQGTTWSHRLTLVRPKQLLATDHALIIVGGGRMEGLTTSPAKAGVHQDTTLLRNLASSSQMLVAQLEQVPNQPVFDGKMEDEAIAYTLAEYFKTGDDRWPLLEPMVKSVVAAMDAAAGFAASAWGQQITGFTLSGESKRGWTTWLTAAVDTRVKGIAPMVFDMLNISAQLPHQLASWGSYSEELGDYSAQGLPQMLATPAGIKLLGVIDPYAYKDQLRQTKVVILATNDRYWPLDAASLYMPDLPGTNFLLYLANSGHETNGHPSIQDDRAALALAAAGRLQLPKVHSHLTKGKDGSVGRLTLTSDVVPKQVKVWQASASGRDFRSAHWQVVKTLTPAPKLEFVPEREKASWSAAFIEATYDLSGHPFTITSELGLTTKAPH